MQEESLYQIISEKTNAIYLEVVEWRRHLHRYPELSYQEEKTAAFVADRLEAMGIPFQKNIGGYGIVAHIKGGNSKGDLIALRADMDALPIVEENEVAYKSSVEGVMHACGHDVHTSNLLGVAKVLQEMSPMLDRDIRLVFQPAEERLPGGASLMIRDGVLKNPKPRCMLGLHVFPQMEVGYVGTKPGPYMASADEIYVTVKGKGGHAALPQHSVDPVVMTAHLITALQSIVSRNADPTVPTVLSFGKIQSKGGATNILPDEVYLEGTFRTMDENWRRQAHQLMKRQAELIAASFGGTCEFRIDKGYPVLVNDDQLTELVLQKSIEVLGNELVEVLPIRLTAEDFAYYSHEVPSCFFRIGTSNKEKNIGAPLHTSRFDIDEEAFKTSVALMSYLATVI